MQIVIERDGKTWIFGVSMGMSDLCADLRAFYDGPLPDIERSFGDGRGVELPARYWRGARSNTIGKDEIPRPDYLDAAVREAIAETVTVST